jgi:hypothetical protein
VTFQPDWKEDDYTEIAMRFGRENAATELRVRTAIESQMRRAAESQLFAWQVVVPKPSQGWVLSIDCSAVPKDSRDLVKAQLTSVISNGIRYVGKTKATMTAAFIGTAVQPKVQSQAHDDQYIITLQTPALLGDPAILTESHSKDDLFSAYTKDFSDISQESLTLVRFFAKQRLEGGTYIYKRFMDGGQFPYQPYFVTCPGSVFVLTVSSKQNAALAAAYISEWTRYGLPPAPWCVNRYQRRCMGGDHWSNHPYLRECGFGEIAVNLNCHWEDPVKIPHIEEGQQ